MHARNWNILARIVLLALVAGWSAAFAAGCASAPLERVECTRLCMGVQTRITMFARHPPAALRAAEHAFAEIARLEQIMSDYRESSELMRLCAAPPGQPVPVSRDLYDILALAQRVAEASDGAFDVTAGTAVRVWREARRAAQAPDADRLLEAARLTGWRQLALDPRTRSVTLAAPGLRLDLGGIAKGAAAEAALRTLRQHGIPRAMVALSGDIAVGESPPGAPGWRIAIAGDRSQPAADAPTLFLRHASISTSGDAEQWTEIAGVRYSHIVDPRTGWGVVGRPQATVIARRGAVADALATAAVVLGPQSAEQAARRIDPNARLIWTWPSDAPATRTASGPRTSDGTSAPDDRPE